MSGFGHGLAVRLDNLGFTVFAGVLNTEGEGAAKLRGSTTNRMHVIKMDVTQDEDVKQALSYVTKTIKQNNIG